MHEYGHYIQYRLNLNNSIGGDHNSALNLIGYEQNDGHILTKSEAINLAWAEAWPTIFGIIAQKEQAQFLGNIQTVCDTFYSNYTLNYNVETTDIRKGEACERSIMAILWDLYDSNNESYDYITMSAREWWNATTASGIYTFSDFIQNFDSSFPGYYVNILENLSYYKMAVQNISINYNLAITDVIFASWDVDYGSELMYFNNFGVYAQSKNNLYTKWLALTQDYSYVISAVDFNEIMLWPGDSFYIYVLAYQQNSPSTGPYLSRQLIDKPIFSTIKKQDNTLEIIGTYGQLSGSIEIPNNSWHYNITSIANNAFDGQNGITSVTIPNSIVCIGDYAFNNCTSLTSVYMSSASITAIGAYTFNNCPISTLSWPNNNITNIGSFAFYGNNLTNIIISANTTYVGDNAFGNASRLTVYCASSGNGWNPNWNPSNRPFIKNCNMSSGCAFVKSFEKSDSNPGVYNGTINNPTRSDYSFSAWYTNTDYTGDSYSSIESAPNGMLYAKWYKQSSSSSCITTGSLITLADGTQTAVENLTGNEQLLVWDMLNGTFSSAPILFIDIDPTTTYDVITLTFSDGTEVEVIDEHAFFDVTLNKYVFLRNDASQYIGHYFTKHNQMLTGTETVQLVDVEITPMVTTAYSPVTYGHLCYYVNGMLSMPGNTESFINIFEVDPNTMAYDETLMLQDIATYGLYTYEEFNSIIPLPIEVFYAFNGQYLKVAIGKGITTLEEIQALLDRYSVFFE